MDAYIITLKNRQQDSVQKLMKSIDNTQTKLDSLNVFEAVEPSTIEERVKELEYAEPRDFRWTWPTDPSQDHLDMMTGVYKFCYDAVNQDKKVATSLSHVLLWDKCVQLDSPIVIFEADALVTRKIDWKQLKGNGVVGLNDPRGATRRAQLFHEQVSSKEGVQSVPVVNYSGEQYPQGLAGHSAYYIEPLGAKKLLDRMIEVGMWPNDAYMCRELFPWIRVVYPYYTKVQRTLSTTTR